MTTDHAPWAADVRDAADPESEAWGGQAPSASYDEWVAEGRAAGPESERIHVHGSCVDWTGPRRAWDNFLSERHAVSHRKGHDGLSACCDATVEPAADRAAAERERQAEAG